MARSSPHGAQKPPLAAGPDLGPASAGVAQAPLLPVELVVNGRARRLELDPRTSLLDALRETLDLTGTKKGCDHGQCGACTVLVNGRRILSCLSLAVTHEGDEVVTVEGLETLEPERAQARPPGTAALGEVGPLHPLQGAFLDEDAFQCGYCTPGQLCSGIALLDELAAGELSIVGWEAADTAGEALPAAPGLDDDELRERMSGNLCRCGAYPNIVAAIARAARARAADADDKGGAG